MSSTDRSKPSPEEPDEVSPDVLNKPESSEGYSSAGKSSRGGDRLDPGTRPLSNRASKAFVIGAFVFIFGLGTIGSMLLVGVAETALDQDPVAPDSVEAVSPNPGEGDQESGDKAMEDASDI